MMILDLPALRDPATAGDIDGAATILSNAWFGGSAGFLLRLVLVSPGVAMRTA